MDKPVLAGLAYKAGLGAKRLYNSMNKRVLAVLAGVAAIVALYAYWQQPKDYDDCVLKHMAGVTSNHAAGYIAQSCRAKFPQ